MLHMSPSTGTESSGGSELRRSPRYQLDVRLRLFATKDGNKVVVHGRGNDISENGMAMFAAHDLEAGQRLDIEFTLPYSRQPLRVLVAIRNRNGYRYGVEFLNLSAMQKEEITRLCKALTLLQ